MESGEPSSMNSMPGDCYHLQGMKFLTAAPLIEALHENVALILEALRKTGVVENRLTVKCFSRCFRSIYGGPQHHFLSVRDIKGFWTSHSSEITSYQLGIPCFLSIFARHQHTSHPPMLCPYSPSGVQMSLQRHQFIQLGAQSILGLTCLRTTAAQGSVGGRKVENRSYPMGGRCGNRKRVLV